MADKAGVSMQVVTDADQIVDYVNDKTGGDSRANDLVTNFTYVGHATPGDLDIGFEDHGAWNMMTNETLDVSLILIKKHFLKLKCKSCWRLQNCDSW